MAADDDPILPAGQNRLDEAELAQAPFERVELVLADPPRVGRVRTEIVDGYLLDDQLGEGGGEAHALRSTTESCRRGWLTPATAPESAGCGSAHENEIDVVRPLAPTIPITCCDINDPVWAAHAPRSHAFSYPRQARTV